MEKRHGILTHLRMDAASLLGDANPFGDEAALEPLKEGEESGLEEYQAVLYHDALSPEVKPLIGSPGDETESARTRPGGSDDEGATMGDCAMIVTRAIRVNRCVEPLLPTHAQKGKCRQVLGQAGPDRRSNR